MACHSQIFTLKCINLGRFRVLLWRTNQLFIYTCKFPQDLTSFPGSCAWITQDLPLTLSSISTPDCIPHFHFSSPSHFHDYHRGLSYWATEGSKHGCTSAINCQCKCFALWPHHPPCSSSSSWYRLLQDQHVYPVSDCSLGLENTSVVVEVTSFEPLQELLVTWELKVLQPN